LKQQLSNVLKGLISVLIAIGFLWMAFRSVPLEDLVDLWPEIQFSWIIYFIPVTVLSLWLRAERWKLLTEKDHIKSSRRVLFAGVMYGYTVNYAVPRLGELTRCYYVAKKEQKPVAAILGTVVLERIIDLVVMLLLLIAVFLFVLSDREVLFHLFGLDASTNWINFYLRLILYGLIALGILFGMGILFKKVTSQSDALAVIFTKVSSAASHFKEGLLSIRTVRHPFLFLLQTIGIWFSYILMTYIPFTMIDGGLLATLSLKEALVITVISAVGVVIPSPGGIGTYHLLVQKGLYLLYQIPETTGMAYALISHSSVMLLILTITPISLFIAGKRGTGIS
jgi:glycosyltransferase 2 family protein